VEKLLLIDGHSILNRAFYGVPDLTNSQGQHTNAIFGFLNILFKILEEEQPDTLIVAFDVKKPTFRHKMYEAYKGTRKPMLPELKEQVPIMQQLLGAMGIPIATLEGYEADDVIGTLAKAGEAKGFTVTVLSGDRDLLQLASDHIKIRIPKTKGGKTEVEDYMAEQVQEKYLVTPTQFIDVKALMGDASDNIPGVPSIGEKTATKLIAQYGSIEAVHEHAEEVKPPRAAKAILEHYDLAVLSKTLATICTQAPIELSLLETKMGDIYTPEAYAYIQKLEFKSFLNRFHKPEEKTSSIEEQFIFITNETEFEAMCTRALQEKIGALQWMTDNGEALGIAIALNEVVYWVPVNDTLPMMTLQIFLSNWLDKLACLAVIDLKSQLSFLAVSDRSKVYDCAIAAYLLNPLKDSYGADDLARDFTTETVPGYHELFAKLSPKEAYLKDSIQFATYACKQAWTAYHAFDVLKERLTETGMLPLYTDMEMPLIYALYDMEQVGVSVNKEALQAYGVKLGEKIAQVQDSIYKAVGKEFNINSPKQLGEILFGEMGLPSAKKTKTGYSTSAEVLEKLAPDYPVVKDILEYRQLTKLKSTYADGLVTFIKEDGRIHGTFNQTITATGRISSTEPNLQNIPIRMELGREIRKVFVPKPGYVFVDADYSQIELRILAHMSQDENLIEAYQSAQDIHAITAANVFKVPLDAVTPQLRRNAKAVNFGIVYGISSFGLSQDLSITRKEANAYIQSYFETYPGIKRFLDESVKAAKEQGYVTTMFGRRRPVPELSSSNFMQRSFGERIAMNSPIQGTAADIMKIAMIRVNQVLKERHLDANIVLQVHDELLVEVREDEVEIVSDILKNEMEQAADLAVNLEVGLETGANWFEAH
jgi:DNA polymerase-1